MATELIDNGTSQAVSADIVIADGSSVTVGLKAFADGCRVNVQIKDDDGGYHTVDTLSERKPQIVIAGPGTFRCKRLAGPSCGVFRG